MTGLLRSRTFRRLRSVSLLLGLVMISFILLCKTELLSSTMHRSRSTLTITVDKEVNLHTFLDDPGKGVAVNNDADSEGDFYGFFNVSDPALLQDDLLNKHKYNLTINNEHACARKKIRLLVLVHSSPGNVDRRGRIRYTWGNFRHQDFATVGPMFLIGQLENVSGISQKEVEEESNTHNDIIQGNFIDSYKNLTYKNIMGLHWVQQYCNQTMFMLKADDDTLVDMTDLIAYLSQLIRSGTKTDFLYCTPILKSAPIRSQSGKTKKWFVSIEDYPYQSYPSYCQGFAYVMSNDVTKRLYDASCNVRYLWIDDLLVTGFLRVKSGIVRTDVHIDHGFTFIREDLNVNRVTFMVANNETTYNKYWYRAWKAIQLKRRMNSTK